MVQKDYGIKYVIETSYSDLKDIQFICKTLKINIVDIEYKENIKLILESTFDAKKELEKEKSKIINIKELETKLITIL